MLLFPLFNVIEVPIPEVAFWIIVAIVIVVIIGAFVLYGFLSELRKK